MLNPTKLLFTPEMARVFREQTITEQAPGSILRDFQVVLDMIGTEGLLTKGTHHLPSEKTFPELNARMSQPLDVLPKRPLLRCYPNLQGMFLLLRASSLGQVRHKGAKRFLVIDPGMLESWRALNPTERYFSLLETWLLHARDGMIGPPRRDDLPPLYDCGMTWRGIPDAEWKRFDYDKRRPYLFGIGTDFHHLVLMNAFGLIDLEPAPRREGKPWAPAGVRRLPFGNAVFLRLCEFEFSANRIEMLMSAAPDPGQWQAVFQPYFPQWRNNLPAVVHEFRDGVYVFKASLGNAWRRIAMSARYNLDALAYAILDAFDFDKDHLYCFEYRNRTGAPVRADCPHEPEGQCTDETFIGDLPLEVADHMEFHFDFGDDWRFDVKLERIDPPDEAYTKPALLETHGKAPRQYREPDWE